MYLGYYAKEYYPNPDINLNDRYIIEEFLVYIQRFFYKDIKKINTIKN